MLLAPGGIRLRQGSSNEKFFARSLLDATERGENWIVIDGNSLKPRVGERDGNVRADWNYFFGGEKMFVSAGVSHKEGEGVEGC